MLSTFPATLPSGAGVSFPELDPGFTPWDDLSSLFDSVPTSLPKHDPFEPSVNLYSSSGSASGSAEPDQNQKKDLSEPVSIMEERKRKRMLSNRLSARRSRMRKLKNLESLVCHVNRLKLENRELTNRFRVVSHNLLATENENRRLWNESAILRRRLAHTNQILQFMQLQSHPTQY